MEKQIEAEMLEIIEKSREEWSHDVTDHTENEYIREGLLNEGYCKQKEGEWIKKYDKAPRYVCSICNHLFNNKEYKYCPNCGAKMKGAEDAESN